MAVTGYSSGSEMATGRRFAALSSHISLSLSTLNLTCNERQCCRLRREVSACSGLAYALRVSPLAEPRSTQLQPASLAIDNHSQPWVQNCERKDNTCLYGAKSTESTRRISHCNI